MKKILSFLFTFLLVFTILVGCGNDEQNTENNAVEGNEGSEIALIIDLGEIDDKSFNQGAYEGITAFAEEHGISYTHYKTSDTSTESIITTIDLAVKGGAKTVLCAGFLFEEAIYRAQNLYPDVNFILIDGSPKDENGNEVINSNSKGIFFKEQEAGFLAGYSAVKDGYRNIGFMGGLALPAVIKYGYGFVQGAEYAAKELELGKDELNIKYTYVGNFDATPENTAIAASWYNEGTEVIFACGGVMGNSVMKAAETAGKKVIGVDVDQSSESESVIISAVKNLPNATYEALEEIYNGSFQGGETITLGAETDNVGLSMQSSKFENFTQEDYEAIYNKLRNGEIEILVDTDAADATQLGTEISNISIY